MKLVFINRYYYPDHSATSQILTDLATDLAASGCQVHVVASRQLYQHPRAALPRHGVVNGVHVHRVWSTRFGRGSLVGRSVDYLSFYFSVATRLSLLLIKGDVVIAKTDPPLISVVAAACAAIKGAGLVNWMQDVFPEVAERLGMRIPARILRGLRSLRDWSLRRAVITVVLGDRMKQELAAVVGLNSERLTVIHNWADSALITPIESRASPLRAEWNVGDRFVVAYSGNMGRAHEFETVLQAMLELRDDEVVFVFIGGGNKAGWLRSEVQRLGLSSKVLFVPYVERARLSQSLGAADVHLVTLRPDLEGLVVPSKFYAIACAARPTIFIGDTNGEIARILHEHTCGFSIAAGDAALLAERIRWLKSSEGDRMRLGANARRALLSYYDRSVAFQLWRAAVNRAGSEAATKAPLR